MVPEHTNLELSVARATLVDLSIKDNMIKFDTASSDDNAVLSFA